MIQTSMTSDRNVVWAGQIIFYRVQEVTNTPVQPNNHPPKNLHFDWLSTKSQKKSNGFFIGLPMIIATVSFDYMANN